MSKKKDYQIEEAELLRVLAEAAGMHEEEALLASQENEEDVAETSEEVEMSENETIGSESVQAADENAAEVVSAEVSEETPLNSFESLGIEYPLLRAIEEMGYEKPMPIQAQVIPVILGEEHRDVVGLAQTGTGKTAAFGLPLLQNIDIVPVYSQYQIRKDPKTGKWLDPEDAPQPQALVLAPTRELCLQIAADLQDYAKYLLCQVIL